MSDRNAVSPVKHFICGGVGGACGILVEYPLEKLVKKESVPLNVTAYGTFIKNLLTTLKNEGPRSVYRGVEVPIYRVAPVSAVTFFSYGIGKRLLQKTPDQQLSFPGLFIAGAISGFLKTLIFVPNWKSSVVTNLKDSVVKPDFPATLKLLTGETGVRSLLKGTTNVFYREVPITGLYFMTYEGMRNLLVPREKRSNVCVLRTIIAGGVAGVVSKSTLLFVEFWKESKGLKSFSGKVESDRAAAALLKHSVPIIIRSFPVSAGCFLGFQSMMKVLNFVAPNPI